jgi:hypothetical protein
MSPRGGVGQRAAQQGPSDRFARPTSGNLPSWRSPQPLETSCRAPRRAASILHHAPLPFAFRSMTDDGRLHTQLPPSPATRASSLTAPKHRLPLGIHRLLLPLPQVSPPPSASLLHRRWDTMADVCLNPARPPLSTTVPAGRPGSRSSRTARLRTPRSPRTSSTASGRTCVLSPDPLSPSRCACISSRD